jgi:thymidylate synthase (FAD)
MNPEFYVPAQADIAFQSLNNKQGRSTEKVSPLLKKKVLEILKKNPAEAYSSYEDLLDSNIARELARITLPLSLYTEWYWQIDLHNFFRFLMLRLDMHAQLEIREYAEILNKIGRTVCPMAFDAFDEHILNGVKFSKTEMIALKNILEKKESGLEGKALDRFNSKLNLNTNANSGKGRLPLKSANTNAD